MNAIEYLIQEHNKHRQLFSLVEKDQTLYPELRSEMIHHVNQEEEVLYTPLLEAKLCEDEIRGAWEEHKHIMQLLKELDRPEVHPNDWQKKLMHLRDLHFRHLDQEEKVLFPRINEWVSEKKLKELKIELKEQKKKISADEILYPSHPGSHQNPPV
jgi:hemerythrin-like domain-containing protein